MANPTKERILAELKTSLESKPNFILVSYSGLNVQNMEDLRSQLRESGAQMKVIKNNVFLRALKESSSHTGKDIQFGQEYFGPLAAVFSDENLPKIAKVCKDYAKTNEKLVLKLGYFDGEVLDKNGVEGIAGLPSKEDLLSIIGRGLNTPAQKIATGMNEVIAGVARGIKAVAEKNGK
ncbi:MAG: 50S ribosomal protein L10 [Leptospiraceae bacterium]|nr:50S ribosomal protein L10 [Leptospiraceae bacterium]MCP5500956.1 50S ribosomal protein L10 [Leptospiraceae bacterium]